ncbi:MAG: heme ABC exporter ATP-binding protein CcmA [Acidobacterium sp.]|nr:heme ABC exporter ATP-binding protein CcmA [Acidobacteriota bacterium]PHY11316.1 MAG: heme ABC exporter ATP-binding protein CcmA [Acidobacterium sp.]
MNNDFETLSVVDLARHYGRRKALSQVNFTCGAGDIIGLLGPNGAGKSTLLNILATLISPSRGRVEYGNRTAAEGGAEVRGRIGMLGHDLFLYPELTARENLVFFAQLYGLPDVRAVAQASLARAGLADRGDDLVSGFSRGMRQRVALERALLHEPRLVLLDEPFTGLDQASTASLVARLRERQQAGCILVMATHDLDVADGLLSRAIYLKNGRLVGTDSDSHGLSERYRLAIQ